MNIIKKEDTSIENIKNIEEINNIEKEPRKIPKNYKLKVIKKTYKDKYKVRLNRINSNIYEVIELKDIWVLINMKIYEEFSNFTDDMMMAFFGNNDLKKMLENCHDSNIDEAQNCMRKIFDKALENFNGNIEMTRKADRTVIKEDMVETEVDKKWAQINF